MALSPLRLRAAAVAALLLAACGPSGYPPSRPRDLGALEAPVRRLVEERVAAVEAAPSDARAHALLGAAYEANGLSLPAAESFAQAAALDGAEPLWPYYQARALAGLGREDAARAALARSLEIDGDFAPALVMRGWQRFDDGDADGAREAFEAAQRADSRKPNPLIGLAALELDAGNATAAKRLAEQALALDRGSLHARFVLGSALVQLGETDLGRRELAAGADSNALGMSTSFSREITESKVNRADVMERASAYRAQGRPDRALELLDILARDFPEDAILQHNRALALQQLGREDDAVAGFERALRIDDRLARTWANLAQIHLFQQRDRDAIEAAERAVDLDDSIESAWNVIAVAKRRNNDLTGALTAARRAVELDPDNAGFHGSLGNVYAMAGQFAPAADQYRRATELAPDVPQHYLSLASASLNQNRLDEARDALARARELNPNERGLDQLEAQLARKAGR